MRLSFQSGRGLQCKIKMASRPRRADAQRLLVVKKVGNNIPVFPLISGEARAACILNGIERATLSNKRNGPDLDDRTCGVVTRSGKRQDGIAQLSGQAQSSISVGGFTLLGSRLLCVGLVSKMWSILYSSQSQRVFLMP